MLPGTASTAPPVIGKRDLRIQARARRAALPPRDLARAEQAVHDAVLPLVTTGPVAAYASLAAEPGTRLLLAALQAAGVPVLLPVLQDGPDTDGDLDWALAGPDLVDGPRGTRHPAGPLLGRDAVADCALLLVPALGVDRTGTRLGQGGGCYDRALARTTGQVVAALHDGELHDRLPGEPHDRPVDAVVLPAQGLVPVGLVRT